MRKLLIACLMLVMSLGMFAQEETNLLTTRATALSRIAIHGRVRYDGTHS